MPKHILEIVAGGLFDKHNKLVGICSSVNRMAREDGTYEVLWTQFIPISTIITFIYD